MPRPMEGAHPLRPEAECGRWREGVGYAADRSMGCARPYRAGHWHAQLLVAELCVTGINVPKRSTSFGRL